MYLSETLKDYIIDSNQDLHQSRLLRLPKPELYVIYPKGNENTPKELTLSNIYFGGEKSAIDVTVRVITDSNQGDILNQFVQFTRIYTEQYNKHRRSAAAIKETLRICSDKDVLREYLNTREKEVETIMTCVFDQARATKFMLKEQAALNLAKGEARGLRKGRTEGLKEGHTKGRAEERISVVRSMHRKGIGIEQIADILDITEAEVMKMLTY